MPQHRPDRRSGIPEVSRRGLAAAALLFASALSDVRAEETVRLHREGDALRQQIVISSRDGRIAWADVLRGISRARGFDDEALQGVAPGGSFSLDNRTTALQLRFYSLLLQPHVSFEVVSRQGRNPQLVITVDEMALLASRRRIKTWLRDKLAPDRALRHRQFGLHLDPTWQAAARDQPVVIAIHGFNSTPGTVSSLLAAARKHDFPTGSFDYPNDQPIEASARLFAEELNQFSRQFPARRVALVAHSMGGLVARAAIENPTYGVSCVERLIMIATPNQGSLLAECDFGLDVWEHAVATRRRDAASRFYAAVEDGLAEAAHDLRPGSQFLRQLNARPRHPRVRYAILLGNRGPLTDEERQGLYDAMQKAGNENRWVRFFGARALAWMADLEEVVDGRGDGVVAVKRGHLAGVDDVVIEKFGHLRVLDPRTEEGAKVQALVLERLR